MALIFNIQFQKSVPFKCVGEITQYRRELGNYSVQTQMRGNVEMEGLVRKLSQSAS